VSDFDLVKSSGEFIWFDVSPVKLRRHRRLSRQPIREAYVSVVARLGPSIRASRCVLVLHVGQSNCSGNRTHRSTRLHGVSVCLHFGLVTWLYVAHGIELLILRSYYTGHAL